MRSLAVLCDVVGRHGGTERYWETVLPQLARFNDVRLLARVVEEPDRFGVRAQQVEWSGENAVPCAQAAEQVARAVSVCDVTITANVFDPLVLAAVRANARRWVARVHDYRAFCPNGNKVFPQFSSICRAPMGAACVTNAIARGCVRGPRIESLRRIALREQVRDRLASADRVLVSSRYVRETCLQNGLPAQSVHVTPPPLPDDAFAASVLAPRHNRVLFSGRFNESKGLTSLVRALARIPVAHRPQLVVCGGGDAAQERDVTMLARRTGVLVSWRGWLAAADLRREIDEASVVAMPSLWPEPFGLGGTESYARGRPVVAYDVGGVREWLAGGGIAVPRADEAALSRAIEHLTANPESWLRHSRAARAAAERYRLSPHIETMRELLAPTHLGGTKT